MTLKQLEYFMALARSLNYTEAAAYLYISQPALSRSISSLERELGVSLLERDHHKVSLTPAGNLLASELPGIKKQIERVMLHVRQAENGLMGRLNVGVLEGQSIDETLQITFRYFSQNLPNVEISPSQLDGHELMDALDRGRLDLILSIDYNLSGRKDLELLQLDIISNCIVMPRDHHLAGRTSVLLADLKRETFVVTGDVESSAETKFFMECCRKAGFSPRLKHAADVRTKLLLIESGFGISMLNAENKACHSVVLKAVPLNDVPGVRLVLAWKKSSGNPSVRLFTHITECCL